MTTEARWSSADLAGFPDHLAGEVLSPGKAKASRDREAKRDLYSRRGLREYWVVNWRAQEVAVYRPEAAALRLAAPLYAADSLEAPLLPGFGCPVARPSPPRQP